MAPPTVHTPTEQQVTQQINNITFSSAFDSGNLAKVKYSQNNNEYFLYTACDAQDTAYETPYTTWFHFSVEGASVNQTLQMGIMNMNKQHRLYKQEFRPFFKIVPNGDFNSSVMGKRSLPNTMETNVWKRLPNPSTIKVVGKENQMQLRFRFKFESLVRGETSSSSSSNNNNSNNNNNNNNNDQPPPILAPYKVFFAFCFPQSYSECCDKLSQYDEIYSPSNKNFYYHREILTHSLDKRRIDLITISSHEGKLDGREEPFNFTPTPLLNPRAHKFDTEKTSKKIVFLSSRVHPGETPAQFVFDGALEFLLSDDVRARQLRKQVSESDEV